MSWKLEVGRWKWEAGRVHRSLGVGRSWPLFAEASEGKKREVEGYGN